MTAGGAAQPAQPSDPSDLHWVDVADAGLGIVVQVPEGWSRVTHPMFPLQVQAPALDGYKLTVSFAAREIDPPTEETFRRWVDATVEAQAREYEGYAELHRGMVSVGGRAAVAVHYRWHPEQLGREIEALWVAVPVATDRLLAVEAAAAAGGDDPLAVARWIVMSTRFEDGS